MSRHRARLARMESKVRAHAPRRLFVIWSGDTPPADLGPNDVVIMVHYVDTPPQEADLPQNAGAVIVLPDNGRGDMPPSGRYV